MRAQRRANQYRLALEQLESRCCPTTVTTLTTIPIPGVMSGDTVTIHATLNSSDPGESGEGEPLIINTSGGTFTVSAYGQPTTFMFMAHADGESITAYIVGSDGTYRFPALSTAVDYEVYAQYRGHKSDTKAVSQFDDRSQVYLDLKIDTK